MWVYFIPLYVLGALVLIFGIVAVLSRVRGGRYIRPVAALLLRAPLLGRLLRRLTRAALERQNPELASAIRKLERAGADKDPQRAQAAMGRMSAAERRAYFEAAEEQGTAAMPTNRAERRRLERMRKGRGI
jgi:hypothetical protein